MVHWLMSSAQFMVQKLRRPNTSGTIQLSFGSLNCHPSSVHFIMEGFGLKQPSKLHGTGVPPICKATFANPQSTEKPSTKHPPLRPPPLQLPFASSRQTALPPPLRTQPPAMLC